MSRRTRWILLALLVVLVGGVAVLVLTQQPKLTHTAQQGRRHLEAAACADDQLHRGTGRSKVRSSAFDAAGGADRDVSKDLHAALDAWAKAVKDGGAGAQVKAANSVATASAASPAMRTGSMFIRTASRRRSAAGGCRPLSNCSTNVRPDAGGFPPPEDLPSSPPVCWKRKMSCMMMISPSIPGPR